MMTQTGIYYEARPKFIAVGIDMTQVGKEFRKNLVRKIEQVCEELGVTREVNCRLI